VASGNVKNETPEKEKGLDGRVNHLEGPGNEDNQIYDAENTILNTLSKKKIQSQVRNTIQMTWVSFL